MLWMADKLRSDEREKALALWTAKGKEAFENSRSVGIDTHA
ncbi:conjugal transfer protein TraD [Methylosinus sp. R-45379]